MYFLTGPTPSAPKKKSAVKGFRSSWSLRRRVSLVSLRRAKEGFTGNWNTFSRPAGMPFFAISIADLREKTRLQSNAGENQM